MFGNNLFLNVNITSIYLRERTVIMTTKEIKETILRPCPVLNKVFFIPSIWYEHNGQIIPPQWITDCPNKNECEVGKTNPPDWDKCPLPKKPQ